MTGNGGRNSRQHEHVTTVLVPLRFVRLIAVSPCYPIHKKSGGLNVCLASHKVSGLRPQIAIGPGPMAEKVYPTVAPQTVSDAAVRSGPWPIVAMVF